jgi:hypothetical protein
MAVVPPSNPRPHSQSEAVPVSVGSILLEEAPRTKGRPNNTDKAANKVLEMT